MTQHHERSNLVVKYLALLHGVLILLHRCSMYASVQRVYVEIRPCPSVI